MPADQPFFPVQGSTTGKSLTINLASTNQGSLTTVSPAIATNLLVSNSAGVTLFVRLSTEAAPVATSLDICMPAGTTRVFENPAPVGTTGVGVTATITGGTAAGLVCFTPGNGGVV